MARYKRCKQCGKRSKRSEYKWLTTPQMEFYQQITADLTTNKKMKKAICTYCEFDLRSYIRINIDDYKENRFINKIKDIELKQPFEVKIRRDKCGFRVFVYNGKITSYGETEKEAMENLEDNLFMFYEDDVLTVTENSHNKDWLKIIEDFKSKLYSPPNPSPSSTFQ